MSSKQNKNTDYSKSIEIIKNKVKLLPKKKKADSNAKKSEVFRLLYTVNKRSGYGKPNFTFEKSKNGAYRNQYFKHIEIIFEELVYGSVMIIKDTLTNQTITSQHMNIKIATIDREDLEFSFRKMSRFNNEEAEWDDVRSHLDEVDTCVLAKFDNSEERTLDLWFWIRDGKMKFSACPAWEDFSETSIITQRKFMHEIEVSHKKYWDDDLNIYDSSYFDSELI